MNLCKIDCAFSEDQPQYNVISPSKSGNNNKSNSRYSGKIRALDGLWLELRNAAVESTSGESNSKGNNHTSSSGGGMVGCLPILMREASSPPLGGGKGINNGFRIDCTGPIHRKSHQRIISIKNLFSNSPKFQKNFQRGVFLSCLIYSEDKILVTLDDVLPTFQIDEDLSSSFQHDFHWLHKISSIWNDAKFLKQEMEKCDSASTLHFRVKLLQAVVTMQESLDLSDLGKVYYKPITTENNNATFLCTVNHLRSTKLVSTPCGRWIPVEKYKSKKMVSDACQFLSISSQNLMLYHQMSNIPLGKGLYIGYFKLVSSVDLLKLIVPEKTPSIIPYVKIRNNPQVSKSEWELLTSLTTANQNFINNNKVEKASGSRLTEIQLAFKHDLDSSLKKLFSNLKIDRNSALNHRFYTTEVIEVSSSVTLLILLPPIEKACLIEGDSNDLKWIEDNKLMTLPVQVFEMTHMLTYHNTLARRLMRLSCTLEVETILAQHNRRKAFSTEEMAHAQAQLSTLARLQTKLENSWKECRWMMEVVKAARAKDKNYISLRDFLNQYNTTSSSSPSSSPSKKLSTTSTNCSSSPASSTKGSYVNANQPFSRLQLQQLLNLRNQSQQQKKCDETNSRGPIPELPGPCIPCNPNFKFESCSSLPIVGKTSTTNLDKLRTSASLFELQLGSMNKNPSSSNLHQKLQHCTQEFMKLGLHLKTEDEPDHHYQNVQEALEGNKRDLSVAHEYQNLQDLQNEIGYPPPLPTINLTVNSSVPMQLDSYMRHQSSRSKLVSLTTMTNRLKDNHNESNKGGNSECVPGTSDPIGGVRTLSWTKQRTSLDRCFNIHNSTTNTTMSCSSICSDGSNHSREILHEDGNETDSSTDVRNSSAFATSGMSKMVEIYAAYECGLLTGTCVRLQITWDTGARQIINLLINKLNEKMQISQNPQHPHNVDDFYLVSVIGARERVLRMDYKPLRLQKPWDGARLFVRKKKDVTAAVSLEWNLRSHP